MRVLKIINSLGTGGAEKLLLDTIPLYREAGIEIDVLVFWNNNHPFINALKDLHCCKVIVLKESENYKDIYALSHIWKLMSYLKQYDLVHVHLFPAQYYTVLARIISGSKCKLIFTEHSVSNRRVRGGFLYRWLDRIIYKQFDAVVAITDEVKEVVGIHSGLAANKIRLIHNGVSIEKIKKATSFSKQDLLGANFVNKKVIIQVSSFRYPKDQMTLIKAIKTLPDEVVLVLVGEGELLANCKLLLLDLEIDQRVFFLGMRMDIPELLKASDIVVLSSKYEGLSLSSIEGMASGRPFVASNVPGLAEIVGGAGVLFECGNAQQLATEIGALLDDKAYYDQVVRTCQERAQKFDIQIMVDKHIKLYESVNEK